MRILYLTPGCFDKGGISRYSRYQINALCDIYGIDSLRVFSLLGPDEHSFETPFPVAWHGDNAVASRVGRVRFATRLLYEALVWKPQLIVCAHVNFSPLVTWLSRVSGSVTVLNVYGLELWSGLSASRKLHMARVDHLISDCHATADHVCENAMHPKKPFVIWDCVDLERFYPGNGAEYLCRRYRLPLQSSRRVVLTLGRLASAARHKGYDRLIEIWNDVLARVPDAYLVIAGRGDDSERLQSKVADLGLSDSIGFAGSIDEQDLPAIYRSCDVFCLVSDRGVGRGEGIPLTPLEAMASGVPVLVGNEDGSCEAVDNNRNGLVTSPRDLSDMTDALVDLLTEDSTNRALRKQEARNVAIERFGYPAFVEKHRKFLSSIALDSY